MNKIICDICGTSYPDTADECPICGCSREMSAEVLTQDVEEEVQESPIKSRAGLFGASRRSRAVEEEEEFDDEDYDEDEDEDYDDFDDDDDLECDGNCAGCDFDCGFDDLSDDDDDDSFGEEEDEDEYFEVICPACGDVINFDSSIDPENLRCPNCGEKFECIVEEDDLKALDGAPASDEE